jgi:hypothetical protein
MPRNKFRNFTEQTELFAVDVPVYFSVLLTLPSLFSYPYSYPPHFPSFSCATIHCSPLNYSFFPFSSTPSPVFAPPFPPTCPPYPSLLHIHHLLASLLYWQYTSWHPAIPDTSTFYYNSRNIPKHTQGPQNPAASIPLPPPRPPLSLLTPPLPIT